MTVSAEPTLPLVVVFAELTEARRSLEVARMAHVAAHARYHEALTAVFAEMGIS